jgi:hypothetical protein
MIDLERMEKLATELVVNTESFRDGTLIRAKRELSEEVRLARALLAVLPVIHAAEKWSDISVRTERTNSDDTDLELAIDAMRRQMQEGE